MVDWADAMSAVIGAVNTAVSDVSGAASNFGQGVENFVSSPSSADIQAEQSVSQPVISQDVPNYGGMNPLAGVGDWISEHTSSAQNELKTDATLAGVAQPEAPKVGSPDWYNTEISNRETAAKENIETPNYGGFNPFAAVGSWVSGGNKAAQENLEKTAEGNSKSVWDFGSSDSSNKENVLSGSEPIPSMGNSFLSNLFGGGKESGGKDQAVTQDEKPIPSIGNSFLDYISKPFQGTSLEEGSKPLPTWANAVFDGGSATKVTDSDGAKVVGKLDTSAPANQKYSLEIAPTAQQITRADYVNTQNLGDNKTKDLLSQGYSLEQALAMQADTSKAAGNGRAERYYRNELDKALENNIALSAQYHSDAMKSGLPQSPNPFAYVGDLSLSTLYKSQGVVNENGSRGLPQYGGSLLKEANVITKAERTFDTGPYNTTNLKSYSSAYGVLPLALQQAIGAQAAKTATERGAGWNINPDVMNKYTPDLVQGAGYGLKYKEAANTLNPADYKSIKGFEQPTIFDYKNNAHVEDIFNTGERTTILNNKGENDQIFGVVNFGNKNENAIDLTKVPGGTKSYVDNKLSDVSGGVLGTGETLGNFTLQNIGVAPLNSRGTAMAGVYRRSVLTHPFLKRKHAISLPKKRSINTVVEKPKSKFFNLDSLNKQVMPKKLGSDLFKFNIGASDKVMKSVSARNISAGSKVNSIAENITIGIMGKNKSSVTKNINLDNVGLPKSKSKSVVNINLDIVGIKPSKNNLTTGHITTGIKLPKNKSGVSGNIKNIMDEAVKAVKIKPMRK